MLKKILIIRFSSFGDIAQCMSTVAPLNEKFKAADIYWVTKEEFGPLVSLDPRIKKVFTLKKNGGLIDLIKLGLDLRKNNFDLIYDAHSNLRSKLLSFLLGFFSKSKIIRRSKNRIKRILLFKFRINLFPRPFKGMESYLIPLKTLGISQKVIPLIPKLTESNQINIPFDSFIVIAPSAAWELKRWPLNYWKDLIALLPRKNFIILGGEKDLFCQELEAVDKTRCLNLAGSISFLESSAIVSKAETVISGDTGIIHVADLLGINGISLMGPSAFGFPTGKHIKVLEVPLDCRPCTKDGRGKCNNVEFKKCLLDIRPDMVAQLLS